MTKTKVKSIRLTEQEVQSILDVTNEVNLTRGIKSMLKTMKTAKVLFKVKNQYDVCTGCGAREKLDEDLYVDTNSINLPTFCKNCVTTVF